MVTRMRRLAVAAIAVAVALGVGACRTVDGQAAVPAPRVIAGVFGGMGPEATADLYQLVVELTPAGKDQEHIATLIYSFPQVPDRTTAIRTGDPAIIPFLVEGVTRLEKAGASFIAIPCNTAHYYFGTMQKAVTIPILNMIELTAERVALDHPKTRKVGLLATSGTIATGLYEKAFAARGIAIVTPDPAMQEESVMGAVYAIKAGGDKREAEEKLFRAGRSVEAKGAEVVVLGCTEIPLAFNAARSGVPVVNATRVLAEATIRTYQTLSLRGASGT